MRASLVLTIAMAGVLAGCSGEPSEADLEKSVKKHTETQLAQAQAVMKQFGQNSMAKDFATDMSKVSVKKLACAKAEGNPGYNCDVEVSRSGEGATPGQKAAVKARFVKADDGWVLIEEKR
jgi:Tfp pilus assembly protein PilE